MLGKFLWIVLNELDTHIIRAGKNASLLMLSLFLVQCLGFKHWALNMPGKQSAPYLHPGPIEVDPAMMRFETACLGSPVHTRILFLQS